jgi:3-oxoacyl-[acyl-carrier protein] reductase
LHQAISQLDKRRLTLAPDGMTVNAIAPALIEGGTTLPGGEEEHRQLATRIPIGRLGRPEEVADAIELLISNAFLTSQSIVIDGGLYPR